MAPAKSKKTTVRKYKVNADSASTAPTSSSKTTKAAPAKPLGKAVKSSTRPSVFDMPESEGDGDASDDAAHHRKGNTSNKRKKGTAAVNAPGGTGKRQKVAASSLLSQAVSGSEPEMHNSAAEREISEQDVAQTLLTLRGASSRREITPTHQTAADASSKRVRSGSLQAKKNEAADSHARVEQSAAKPARSTRGPQITRQPRTSSRVPIPDENSPSVESQQQDEEEPVPVTPSRQTQPILAKEYIKVELTLLEPAGFCGFGSVWNEIVRSRQVLLKNRVEVTSMPLWYLQRTRAGEHYPFSEEGKRAFHNININVGALLDKLEAIRQSLEQFDNDGMSQTALARADLCHLIIPRIIRLIAASASNNKSFRLRDGPVPQSKLQRLENIRELLDCLMNLSRIAQALEVDDVPAELSSEVEDALTSVLQNCHKLHGVVSQVCETGLPPTIEVEAQADQVAKKKKRDKRQARPLRKSTEDKEREHEELLAAQRAEQARLVRKAKQCEEAEHLDAQRAAELRSLEEETIRLQNENAKKDAERELRKTEQEQQRRREQAEREATKHTELMDLWFKETTRLGAQRAHEYYTKMAQVLIEEKTLNMSKFGTPNKPLQPLKPSNSKGPSWTQELSAVLIKRLAMFEDLTQEAKYARCLDCEELQSMSIEAVRARALEMRPTLEEWYTKKEQVVPLWILSIT